MFKYINLKITDVDNFCKNMNTLKYSDINVGERNHSIDGKSLLGLITLDFTKQIRVEIITNNEYELKLFEEILNRYS